MSENKVKVESQEDLDLFLTGVESKLRGPFSSLDLAKAISNTALRGSHTPKEYLQLISKVLSRTDKVIQLRILIGLLGLDASNETNEEIYGVLQQAQDATLHEEWVRTVSGLIQGCVISALIFDFQVSAFFLVVFSPFAYLIDHKRNPCCFSIITIY